MPTWPLVSPETGLATNRDAEGVGSRPCSFRSYNARTYPRLFVPHDMRACMAWRVADDQLQVFDIAFFLKEDPSEYCDLNYSLFAVERWYLTVDDIVYSKRMRPLLTIVVDTCRVHDWIGGYCSHDLNRFLGDDRPGCREVLEAEMQKISLDPRCLVPSACLNPFMNC
jgi:hypothetical protein